MEDNQKQSRKLPDEPSEEANSSLEHRVQLQMQDLEKRLVQIHTAVEITQLTNSSSNLDDLLHRVAMLILDRYGYDLVLIFLLDRSCKVAELVEVAGAMANHKLRGQVHLEVGSQSIVGWVTQNNQPQIASDEDQDHIYHKLDFAADTRSEACIPIAANGEVLGALDVQANLADAFDADSVAALQIIANHIGSVMQNIRMLDSMKKVLRETTLLYDASQLISKAISMEDVLQIVWGMLHESGYPHIGLRVDGNGFTADLVNLRHSASSLDPQIWSELSPSEVDTFLDQSQPLTILEKGQFSALPAALGETLNQGEWMAAAFFPIKHKGKLQALIILGALESGWMTSQDLQPFARFIEFTSLAVEKLDVMQTTTRRLAALQTINTIGQTISVEINLQNLYRIIHHEVEKVMGEVNFLIATYDPQTRFIQIPYMHEGEEIISLEPFPLGEGLTSILINTRQPLMIVTDTVNKARELGAKVIGQPARSWMGAPLLVAGEVVGAMIVQDLEREFRFDENDLQLLVTLASQVGVAIRNARLLESTQRQSERQSKLYDITNRIRSATNMQEILVTTADELRKGLNIYQAHIEVNIQQPVSDPVSTGFGVVEE